MKHVAQPRREVGLRRLGREQLQNFLEGGHQLQEDVLDHLLAQEVELVRRHRKLLHGTIGVHVIIGSALEQLQGVSSDLRTRAELLNQTLKAALLGHLHSLKILLLKLLNHGRLLLLLLLRNLVGAALPHRTKPGSNGSKLDKATVTGPQNADPPTSSCRLPAMPTLNTMKEPCNPMHGLLLTAHAHAVTSRHTTLAALHIQRQFCIAPLLEHYWAHYAGSLPGDFKECL